MSDLIGHRLLNLHQEFVVTENNFEDAILEFDPNAGWESLTYDDYDSSMEFKGVPLAWRPSTEVVQYILDSGFSRFWVCYQDGSERYYWNGMPADADYHKPPANRKEGRNG